MTALQRRLVKLETANGVNCFSRFSDEELTEQLISVCEGIEAMGGDLPLGWRDQIQAQDYAKLAAMEIANA